MAGDLWFDETAADAAAAFFPKYLRHTEGEWYGEPFELAPWQRQWVREVFGWKRADGTRRYRLAYLVVGRKNGKTELAAGVALLMLIGDGEFGGQGYALAVDKEQARIVFHKASLMVQLNPALGRLIEALKTSLYCPELAASFRPLSSRPATKHGFSPSFAIADETHEYPDGELVDVVHKGTGARRQPLEVFITTAGIRNYGYGWQLHQRALKVRDGVIDDPSMHVAIYAADPDDDWTAEETWRKANPSLGVTIKLDYLREECARAREAPRAENDFRRFHLNQWVEQAQRWLPLDRWDACAGPHPWGELAAAMAGRRCFSAVDLSTKVDLTALMHAFEPIEEGDPWVLVPRLFMPADNIARRVERDRVPYDDWIRRGAIVATPGNVLDYAFVEHALLEDAGRFEIAEVAFDPWNAMQFAVRMQEEGLKLVEFRQGYASMSGPAKDFEAMVLGGKLAHGGHPVLRWMASNVAIASDPAGNIKPAKDRSSERIDGIVAAIMAYGRATAGAAQAESVYETAGFVL